MKSLAICVFRRDPPRHVPPPLPPDGGGFYYLKRDGAILLKRDGSYWQFDSEDDAIGHAAVFASAPVTVRFMPKLRTH